MALRKKPAKAFATKFEFGMRQLSLDFLKSAEFQHAATKGVEREKPVQEFLRAHLPQTYAIACGEVVDVYDVHSPQLDVMVYDGLRNFAFYTGNSLLLPAEALLVSIEVKSRLTRDEIHKSLEAAKRLKSLRPFRAKLPTVRRDGARRDYKCRYFHCLFAYSTDLVQKDWLAKEAGRFAEVSQEHGLPMSSIDRVYVARRGLLNLPFDVGIEEVADDGLGLMHFYMHVLNFLFRENAARKAVPLLEYAGRLTKGWRPLSP